MELQGYCFFSRPPQKKPAMGVDGGPYGLGFFCLGEEGNVREIAGLSLLSAGKGKGRSLHLDLSPAGVLYSSPRLHRKSLEPSLIAVRRLRHELYYWRHINNGLIPSFTEHLFCSRGCAKTKVLIRNDLFYTTKRWGEAVKKIRINVINDKKKSAKTDCQLQVAVHARSYYLHGDGIQKTLDHRKQTLLSQLHPGPTIIYMSCTVGIHSIPQTLLCSIPPIRHCLQVSNHRGSDITLIQAPVIRQVRQR